MSNIVAITHDPSVDVVYVAIGDKRPSARQICVGDSLIVDVGADGEPAGVEIIGARLQAR